MKRLSSFYLVAMMILVLSGSPVMAMLVDGSFEDNPLGGLIPVLTNFTPDVWGVESATIYTGTQNGVTPADGVDMLRMTTDGLTATQAVQVTDVSAFASSIDNSLATFNLSAVFNVGSGVPDACRARTV